MWQGRQRRRVGQAASEDRAVIGGAIFWRKPPADDLARKRSMIEPARHRLSIAARCPLLLIRRSNYYNAPVPETAETLAPIKVINAAFLDLPLYGIRQMVRQLRRGSHDVGRRRVRRLLGSDVTYIPVRRGFVYLVAIMDWASRKVLALGLVEHDGCGLLRGGAGGSASALRKARDL